MYPTEVGKFVRELYKGYALYERTFSITAFNIFATTMIGKLIIPKFVPKNSYDQDAGKEYLEDVIIDDVLHIGTKWHNLSPYEVLANKVKQKYNIN